MTARARTLLVVATLGLATGIASRQASPQPSSGRQEAGGTSTLQRELDRHVPEIAEAMRTAGYPLPTTRLEADALTAKLAGEGYKRLDDPLLTELLSMRSALAELSDEVFCAAMWTGPRAIAMAPALVLYLSEERQRRWARISVAAQLAEIHNRPPKRAPPPERQTQSALGRLFKALAPDDARFLLEAMQARRRLTVAERCKATQLLYHGLNTIGPTDALVIFRGTLYD